MIKPTDVREQLHTLMNILAEQVETVADKELLDDAVAEGYEVKIEATRIRTLLLEGVLRAKKDRMRQAQEAHQQSVADISARATRIPNDAAVRRELLMHTLQHRPQMRDVVVTLQYRNFESFSDADVESTLQQFAALGLLDDDCEHQP